jgi:hypothetical protein
MNTLKIFLVILSLLGIADAQTTSGQVTITLGEAGEFALLGGSGITNVSALTSIVGDVGSSPTPTITGLTQSQVNGKLYHVARTETALAQTDLTTAYNQAADAPCGTDLTGEDLGGMTLGPGVYCFSTSAGLTGTLTLDAQGNPNSQWVFQIGSTLTTATDSTVAMVLGKVLPAWSEALRGCNVYWQVGSSATLGTGSTFIGQIMALTSITLDSGLLRGKALASNGAVTISAQERVDGPSCVSPS